MKQSMVVTLCLCLAVSIPFMAQAQDRPLPGDLQVGSDTLGAVVLGQKIQLMMRDGTYLEGKVLQAGRNEIVMDVKKREPKGSLHGTGGSIRTEDIAVIHMTKSGSVAAPVALGVIGGLLGAAGSAYAADRLHDPTAFFSIFLLSTAGGATGGALLGRAAAKKRITISVVPGSR
jgi:hypothetical protein